MSQGLSLLVRKSSSTGPHGRKAKEGNTSTAWRRVERAGSIKPQRDGLRRTVSRTYFARTIPLRKMGISVLMALTLYFVLAINRETAPQRMKVLVFQTLPLRQL
jgi:hypothetical protein